MWGSWSEPSATDCPATRTRTRTCMADTNAVTQNVTRTFPCSTICNTSDTDTEEGEIIPERCQGNINDPDTGGKMVYY